MEHIKKPMDIGFHLLQHKMMKPLWLCIIMEKFRYYHYNNELMAFRPVVCLSSDVTLSLNEQTGKYEISK